MMVDLLDPGRAPLHEVAMTVQFEPIAGLTSAHIGVLWERAFRREYGRVEEHAPVEPVFELESPALQQAVALTVRFSERPPFPRFFFVSSSGAELVQIQDSRISYNWRRRGDLYDYPRYATLRQKFSSAVEKLVAYLASEGFEGIRANQAELLYVNHVLYAKAPGAHRDLGALIAPLSRAYRSLAGAPIEDISMGIRHSLSDADGKFAGRISVGVTPAYVAAERIPIYQIAFAARGRPRRETVPSAMEFLDYVHPILVSGFGEFFSASVQENWKAFSC